MDHVTARPWDIFPDHVLLDPEDDGFGPSPTFEACLNAHGMYETMRFVLRLSPRNHELMESLELGEASVAEISSEALQAYATYVHETVHWWQHVGSTSGLIFSLSYLAQCHSSLAQLREVLATYGPKKSLKTWTDRELIEEGHSAQARLAAANIAVNNALDVEYYKIYAHDPVRNVRWLIDQRHFECVGHGYHMVYGQLVGMLSDTADEDFAVIPDARAWDAEFARLARDEVEGYFHGSSVHVPPVGLHAIYEGQARFIQLQFLSRTRAGAPSYEDWRKMGFLSGIYVEAFDQFLYLSQSGQPESLDDPLIGLFLLVCDLAINPTRGFPIDIESFEEFVTDVDVGVRFTRLSLATRAHPHLRAAIRDFSQKEYIEVSEVLTGATGYDHPLAALNEIARWVAAAPRIQRLMAEYETFEFDPMNMPLRVFFSHFIAFALDKLEHPEFFCWPGAQMVGTNVNAGTMTLWLKHLSLFTDRGDKRGVYPRRWPGRDERAIQHMFEQFYSMTTLYDLTRQWILRDGDFICDFDWLSSEPSDERAWAWADAIFQQAYGVALSDFEIVA